MFVVVARKAWLSAVKSDQPLVTISRLLKHLVPQVEDLINKTHGSSDESQVIHAVVCTSLIDVNIKYICCKGDRVYSANNYGGLAASAASHR